MAEGTKRTTGPADPEPQTIQFEATASQPRHGIVVVYDLEGFSKFFNQPDVQDYVPLFINRVSDAISRSIYGGKDYWADEPDILAALEHPVHEKYLGDGAMYIWIKSQQTQFSAKFVEHLCNRLWNIKRDFDGLLRAAADDLPVVDVPSRIRFGIARGTVYELQRRGSKQREYIGFCINLATRLQKYCPELGFIASARIGMPQTTIERNAYIKVVAKAIKGFPREVVLVGKGEWDALGPSTRDNLFEAL